MWRHLLHYQIIRISIFAHEQLVSNYILFFFLSPPYVPKSTFRNHGCHRSKLREEDEKDMYFISKVYYSFIAIYLFLQFLSFLHIGEDLFSEICSGEVFKVSQVGILALKVQPWIGRPSGCSKDGAGNSYKISGLIKFDSPYFTKN